MSYQGAITVKFGVLELFYILFVYPDQYRNSQTLDIEVCYRKKLIQVQILDKSAQIQSIFGRELFSAHRISRQSQ